MKIDDLIQELQVHRATLGNTDVVILWEGTVHRLTPSHIYSSKNGVLILDADSLQDKKWNQEHDL